MNKQSGLTCRRCRHTWRPRVADPVQCPACHSAYWNRAAIRNPRDLLDLYLNVFEILNEMKSRRIIRGWAIFGSVAFMYYGEPLVTMDTDIMVTTTRYENYWESVLPELEKRYEPGPERGMFNAGGLLVQILPATGYELWESAVRTSKRVNVHGVPIRIVDPEHLIVLGLIRFDQVKDLPRIAYLLTLTDRTKLDRLLEHFDDNGSLRRKLARVPNY